MDIYFMEVGVLLPKEHLEYDSYSCAWDRQNAYYDEGVDFFIDKDKAINRAKRYVDEGVPNTYALVAVNNADVDDDAIQEIKEGCWDDDITNWLDVRKYVFSLYKDDKGTLHENFVKGEYV